MMSLVGAVRAGAMAGSLGLAAMILGAGPASAAEVDVATRIDSVLVFPLGAEVTRRGKVTLEAGQHTLRLDDLPVSANADSIRVEGRATGAVAIGSVDSRRRFVGAEESEELAPKRKELEDEIRKLEDDRALVQGEIDAANAQGDLLRNLVALPSQGAGVVKGEAAQPLRADDWTGFVALVGTGLKDVGRTIVEAQQRQRDIDEKLTELRARLGELAPKQREVTEVQVNVEAEAAAELDLVVTYQVGNASWTPLYDARLASGSKTQKPVLSLKRLALVTQRTGEDWSDVAVALSTTQPSSGSAVPVLQPVVVDYKPEPPPQPVAAARERIGRALRGPMAEPQVAQDMVGGGLTSAAPMAMKRTIAKPVEARIVNAPFQAVFEVPGRTSVPSTGEAKRLSVTSETLSPTLEIKAVPKREAKAYLYAKMTLGDGAPALEGPVSLFRDGVFVGKGRLPTLAGGEEHELGFGVDDLVRVKHTVAKEQRGEAGLISSSRTDSRSYRITVKNLHDGPVTVSVLDQLPVPLEEDIKVERSGTQPTKTDVDGVRGVVAWTNEMAPDQEKVIDFGYRVLWPAGKEVVYRNR